jgi:hypothetical protein
MVGRLLSFARLLEGLILCRDVLQHRFELIAEVARCTGLRL